MRLYTALVFIGKRKEANKGCKLLKLHHQICTLSSVGNRRGTGRNGCREELEHLGSALSKRCQQVVDPLEKQRQ